MVIIGYSGHAFVVCDILSSQNIRIVGYCDNEEKKFNPYQLLFLDHEKMEMAISQINSSNFFTAIGDNQLRRKINHSLQTKVNKPPINAIHKNASISTTVSLGNGIMVGDGAIVNACTVIGDGVICNTQSVIEHECTIGAFSHIAPGAVLCGNVEIGENSFVGARAVVKQDVKIGTNVIVGAGTVVIRDIPDNSKVVENPQKFIP